jgi:hypothetical protein
MLSRKMCLFVTAVVCVAVFSVPTFATTTLGFSTGGTNNFSWTVTLTGGAGVLSFENNEVDTSNPAPDAVLNDRINLPSMSLTNIQSVNVFGVDFITATLAPITSTLTLIADIDTGAVLAGTNVMTATVGSGGFLTVGTNFIAYSNQQDDLDIQSHEAGYSAVIDEFVAWENQGFGLDMSFGGDSSTSLFLLLGALNDGSVSGTLSGQIVAAPEPATMTLLGIGGLSLLCRRKET